MSFKMSFVCSLWLVVGIAWPLGLLRAQVSAIGVHWMILKYEKTRHVEM